MKKRMAIGIAASVVISYIAVASQTLSYLWSRRSRRARLHYEGRRGFTFAPRDEIGNKEKLLSEFAAEDVFTPEELAGLASASSWELFMIKCGNTTANKRRMAQALQLTDQPTHGVVAGAIS